MATLRVTFLSALALELTAAVATAIIVLRQGKVVQRGSYAEYRLTALSGRR
jgi:ABC-type transport system involved in cytochrome bd biosynthesis fused ATPase/permease subunit